jgi:hypothetical protein
MPEQPDMRKSLQSSDSILITVRGSKYNFSHQLFDQATLSGNSKFAREISLDMSNNLHRSTCSALAILQGIHRSDLPTPVSFVKLEKERRGENGWGVCSLGMKKEPPQEARALELSDLSAFS